jgi:cytochrome c biogenesis protein CcdA
MLATVVDTQALLKTVIAAAIAGVGVTLVFSLAIFGAAGFVDMTRDNRPAAAIAFGILALAGLTAAAAAVTIGIIVMSSK